MTVFSYGKYVKTRSHYTFSCKHRYMEKMRKVFFSVTYNRWGELVGRSYDILWVSSNPKTILSLIDFEIFGCYQLEFSRCSGAWDYYYYFFFNNIGRYSYPCQYIYLPTDFLLRAGEIRHWVRHLSHYHACSDLFHIHFLPNSCNWFPKKARR